VEAGDVAEAKRLDDAPGPDIEGGDSDPERGGGELLLAEGQASPDRFAAWRQVTISAA
jgi:hypothetical protein